MYGMHGACARSITCTHVRACEDRENASLVGIEHAASAHHSLRIDPLSVSFEM